MTSNTVQSVSYYYPTAEVAARFNHGRWDYLYLALRIVDHGVIEEELDSAGRTLQVIQRPAVTRRLKLRMSTAFDPIPDMIAWLEALACGVQEASWYWEGEGPFYRLTSNFRQLIVVEGEVEIVRVELSRERLIQAIYLAFRRFGTSRRYRPDSWEWWAGMGFGRCATSLPGLRSELVERYLCRSFIEPTAVDPITRSRDRRLGELLGAVDRRSDSAGEEAPLVEPTPQPATPDPSSASTPSPLPSTDWRSGFTWEEPPLTDVSAEEMQQVRPKMEALLRDMLGKKKRKP